MEDLFELQTNLFILHLLQKRLSSGVLEKSSHKKKLPYNWKKSRVGSVSYGEPIFLMVGWLQKEQKG